jgi:di/tricarboxylate transporter
MPDSVVEQYSKAPVNTKQKIGIVTLLGYMLILLLPSFFTNMPGAAFINNLGVGAMSAVGLLVLAAMFTPFLCPLIQRMGGNPYVMWFLMYFSLNASFVTPAASFQSAMVHGHDRVSSKWCYITGTAYAVFTWIVLVLVTIPLANALC